MDIVAVCVGMYHVKHSNSSCLQSEQLANTDWECTKRYSHAGTTDASWNHGYVENLLSKFAWHA